MRAHRSIAFRTGDTPTSILKRLRGATGASLLLVAGAKGGDGDNLILTGFAPAGTGQSFASNVSATNGFALTALAVLPALAGVLAAQRFRAR